jgi:hypothetical protein
MLHRHLPPEQQQLLVASESATHTYTGLFGGATPPVDSSLAAPTGGSNGAGNRAALRRLRRASSDDTGTSAISTDDDDDDGTLDATTLDGRASPATEAERAMARFVSDCMYNRCVVCGVSPTASYLTPTPAQRRELELQFQDLQKMRRALARRRGPNGQLLAGSGGGQQSDAPAGGAMTEGRARRPITFFLPDKLQRSPFDAAAVAAAAASQVFEPVATTADGITTIIVPHAVLSAPISVPWERAPDVRVDLVAALFRFFVHPNGRDATTGAVRVPSDIYSLIHRDVDLVCAEAAQCLIRAVKQRNSYLAATAAANDDATPASRATTGPRGSGVFLRSHYNALHTLVVAALKGDAQVRAQPPEIGRSTLMPSTLASVAAPPVAFGARGSAEFVLAPVDRPLPSLGDAPAAADGSSDDAKPPSTGFSVGSGGRVATPAAVRGRIMQHQAHVREILRAVLLAVDGALGRGDTAAAALAPMESAPVFAGLRRSRSSSSSSTSRPGAPSQSQTSSKKLIYGSFGKHAAGEENAKSAGAEKERAAGAKSSVRVVAVKIATNASDVRSSLSPDTQPHEDGHRQRPQNQVGVLLGLSPEDAAVEDDAQVKFAESATTTSTGTAAATTAVLGTSSSSGHQWGALQSVTAGGVEVFSEVNAVYRHLLERSREFHELVSLVARSSSTDVDN